MTDAFERAAKVTSEPLESILAWLHQRGLIDDIDAWGDRQLALFEELENAAVASAHEHGMPPPMVQRAIRRLKRPRVHSCPEREAREVVARGPSDDTAQELLRQIIGQYVKLLDVPRLDGGLELFLENQLRFLGTIYRLLLQASAAAIPPDRRSS